MRLFDPEGPLMGALGKLSDVVLSNILFCVLSLPIVTAGASLTALYTVMQELAGDRLDGMVFRVFWDAFRKNFKQATALWLLCLLAFAFLFLYYHVVAMLGGALGRAYQITFYVLLFAFLFGFQYLFPLQARFQNRVRDTLRNAWLLSVLALPQTLLSFLVDGGLIYLSFFLNPNALNVSIFLWAAAGFGLLACLNSYLFRRAFEKIAPQVRGRDADGGRAEGAIFTDEGHRAQDLMIQESTFSDPDWNRRKEPEKKKKDRKRSS